MTLFPEERTLTNGFVVRTCSAIMGDTFDLIPPVPRPMMIMAAIKPGKAAPFSIDMGRDVKNKMTIPTMYTMEKYLMVRYLPRN